MSKVRIVRVSVLDRDGHSSDVAECELATLVRRQPDALVVTEIQCTRERHRSVPSRRVARAESRTTSRLAKRPQRMAV